MRIRNLLMLGAFLAMSGGAYTQSMTAADARVYPNGKGAVNLSLKTPSQIAGWQMSLVLPEGISVESASKNLKIGSTDPVEANFMDVLLSNRHTNHVVLGGESTTGEVVLVCFPTNSGGTISGTDGDLCSVILRCDASKLGVMSSDNDAVECTVKGIYTSDANGVSAEAPSVTFKLTVHPVGDANGDWDVNVADLQAVLNDFDEGAASPADVNNDGEVNVADLQAVLNEM